MASPSFALSIRKASQGCWEGMCVSYVSRAVHPQGLSAPSGRSTWRQVTDKSRWLRAQTQEPSGLGSKPQLYQLLAVRPWISGLSSHL